VSAPIFISYSSKDQDIAETICKALESRGNSCWISCRDVAPGENFQEAIVRALRGAKVMLLVFTANANNSDEIKKELVLAGRHQVTVVPVRVEDVVPNDAFSYEFATRQWVDLYKNWEQEIELLSSRLEHLLQNDKPAIQIQTAAASPFRGPQKKSNQPLIWGGIATVVAIAIGGGAYQMRPAAKPAPAPATTPSAPAAQTMAPPPVSPPPQPQAAAQAPPSAPPPQAAPSPLSPPVQVASAPPQINPEQAAWEFADGADNPEALGRFVKDFPASVHAQEAQLRLANLIRTGAPPIKSFDGTWQTEWSCPNLGSFPGYTYSFNGQVKDGVYHGVKGVKGEPSSMVIDGRIEADGTAGFAGEIIVGSSLVGLGAARGTPSDFHALAHFDHGGGNGKRIEGRPCTLTFIKQ
jgi:hypothetical protein